MLRVQLYSRLIFLFAFFSVSISAHAYSKIIPVSVTVSHPASFQTVSNALLNIDQMLQSIDQKQSAHSTIMLQTATPNTFFNLNLPTQNIKLDTPIKSANHLDINLHNFSFEHEELENGGIVIHISHLISIDQQDNLEPHNTPYFGQYNVEINF